MNLSAYPPLITRSNMCASDFEFEERRSFSSRANIYVHNIIIALTFLMTHVAAQKMLAKNIFSMTTRNLLFCCMIYYVLHDVYFLGTMDWSFFRSVVYADDRCQIMFLGSECFFLYIAGVFFRILLLTSQVAITVERLVVTIFPNSDFINTVTVNIMTIILSIIGTSVIKPPTNSPYSSPNCFQQMFVGMKTLRSLIFLMILFVVFCFPVNCIIMIKHRLKFRKMNTSRGYSLTSRFTDKTHMYASMAVSFISFIQTVIYAVYIAALDITLRVYITEDGLFYGNSLALWFYTFPLAGLALPTSIILSYAGLTIKKNNKVGVTIAKKCNQQEVYFTQLKTAWEKNNNGSRLSIT